MYLTEDEARERLASPQNLANVVVEYRRRTGRPAGSTRLTPAAREIVAQAARVLPCSSLAKAFGIHRKTVSDLKRGVTNHITNGRQAINRDLQEATEDHTKERVEAIKDKALDILVATLETVDPTRVKGERAKVQMAKDLATIHEKMSSDGSKEGLTKVLIYTPRQKELKEFDVIDIPAVVVGGGGR